MKSLPVGFWGRGCSRVMWMVAVTLLAAGCGTIEPRYKPTTMGPLPDTLPINGLACEMQPDQDTYIIGDVIQFNVSFKNEGREGFWFPANPEVMMVWAYPDGYRDNFMFEFKDQQQFLPDDSIWIGPGQTGQAKIRVKTYYFDRDGITEFRAVCNIPQNTNPDLFPFWKGQFYSNSYGVRMVRK